MAQFTCWHSQRSQSMTGTVIATSYGQNCHAMSAQLPLFTKLYFLLYFKTYLYKI